MLVRSFTAFAVGMVLAGCAFTENRQVSVTPEHLECRTDDDCTLASLACATCGDPVAKKYSKGLRKERDRVCKRYRGPVFDCSPYQPPICKSGRCSASPEPWDPQL